MKVTPAHLLDVARLALIPGGNLMETRRCAVIHYTQGATAQSSIDYWNKPKCRKDDIAAHLIIDRNGTIYQCRPFDRTVSHAGSSRWRDPKTGTLYKMAKRFSIGIELANAGNGAEALSWARKQPGFTSHRATHRNGGKECEWEDYPDAQIDACVRVCQVLVARYNLDDVTGHDCIAPERKIDPGPLFPILGVRQVCGFIGKPAVHLA